MYRGLDGLCEVRDSYMLLNAKGKGLFTMFLPVWKSQKKKEWIQCPLLKQTQVGIRMATFVMCVPGIASVSLSIHEDDGAFSMWLMKIHIKDQCNYRALSGVLSPWQSLVLTPKHR